MAFYFDNMFDRGIAFAFAASALLVGSKAAGCNPQAMSLPFKGQRLTDQAEMRGVSLSVGSPGQNLSLVLCA